MPAEVPEADTASKSGGDGHLQRFKPQRWVISIKIDYTIYVAVREGETR